MSRSTDATTDTPDALPEKCIDFLETYYQDEIAVLAQQFPKDSTSLWIDYDDVFMYDMEFADDLRNRPEDILDALSAAVQDVNIPLSVDLSDVTVRVYGLNDASVFTPGQIRSQHGGQYIGVTGILERVTSTSDLPRVITYKCQRDGYTIDVPQDISTGELQEPHECPSCERQGPFKIKENQSKWSDYTKLRIQARPDANESESGKIVGYALDDLIEEGGDTGLMGRVGEPVTVYGICKRRQKSGRGENELLFDHILEARAIDFERDAETVDVEEHRDEFTELANQHDAIDQFAASIAPQLHETEAWDTAMEFAVAYLFGAPRIDVPNGPTYRGDLHFLIVSDYGMGKSTFKEEIESYSPKCISKSTTALSSGVGLTAAAVKDDFGEGQWTIKPGLLVRANGGHLILDEIDKGPDELTEMNDAIEGQQVVDVEKAGKSATYDSKCGLLALGNPVDGKFDGNTSISEQLDMSETLLSRFDAIVTMEDEANEEMDQKIAETWGKSYTEAQKAEIENNQDFKMLERSVSIAVGRAWVKYARENINPILDYDQFTELEDWYAAEVRQLNEKMSQDAKGDNMPVPVTVRVLGAVTKMAIAFARVHLREQVNESDIERAKKLGKRLVKQNWDGERFDSTKNLSKSKSDGGARKQIMDVLEYDNYTYLSDIVEKTGLDMDTVQNRLQALMTEYRTPKVEEKNNKYKKLR